MHLTSAQRRRLDERRHVVGGLILVAILFFGHYLPGLLNLGLMLLVTWMAIIVFRSLFHAVIISLAGFAIPFAVMAARGWKTKFGVYLGPWESAELGLDFSLLCTMLYGAMIWVKALLKKRSAGFDEVLGACNLYIWIATIYACIYTIISKINVHAFQLHEVLTRGVDAADMRRNFSELYYFSFVTQTTLGYGDIIPVSHFARAFAISQAIIGQFYVAVVLTYILNLWIRDLGQQVREVESSFDEPEKAPERKS
jgi:hypothetical protein